MSGRGKDSRMEEMGGGEREGGRQEGGNVCMFIYAYVCYII